MKYDSQDAKKFPSPYVIVFPTKIEPHLSSLVHITALLNPLSLKCFVYIYEDL